MTAPTTIVAGQALYLELRRSNAGENFVFQIVITPEAMCNGNRVPMSAYRRRLSTSHPRRTWKQLVSPTNTAILAGVSDPATGMAAFLDTTLSQLLATQSSGSPYQLVGDPILVNVAEADLLDVRLGKTPYKVLGRIWKVRKAMSYPAEFI